MRKASEQAAMIDSVRMALLNIGAMEQESWRIYGFVIDTKYGFLEISLSPDMIRRGEPVKMTIFTRFKESRRDNLLGGHTGKWNWHGQDREGAKWVVSQIADLRPKIVETSIF